MTALFVGNVLSGRKIPEFNSLYNLNLERSPDDLGLTQDEKQAIIVKEKLLDFAMNHNKQRKASK